MTEATLVSQQGTERSDSPGIWSDEQVDGWKKIVDSVHNSGGAIFSQVWHAGRVSHPDMDQQKLSGKVW
jgi:2,4-dienoyl-CoA reductase-like NADH-dependent reductase (Old Yellow Enzyme family)